MRGRWRKVAWMSGLALVLVISYCLIYLSTMTAWRADLLFARTFRPGDSGQSVEAWLASQGYTAGSYMYARGFTSYCRKSPWSEYIGDDPIPERAGLKVNDVTSMIVVSYPFRDGLFGGFQVRVYCFLDADDRLIKHWVYEQHLSL